MSGPLDGIRVVEMGVFVAGPAVGMLLADWGAEVIKIEPPAGDPWRYNQVGKPLPGLEVPVFELDDRGKRSVILDLKQTDDREVALRLVGCADVFLSNMRARALESLGVDPAVLRARFPELITLQVTGYGLVGPDVEKPGFDLSAYWARAGFAMVMGEPGAPPVIQRGANGDHATALAGAGAICAALYRRSQTGQGDQLHVSLAGVGAYVQGVDNMGGLQGSRRAARESREQPVNPLFNTYQTAEGRWIMLACLQGQRHWPDVCQALDRVDLMGDERFLDNRERFRNSRALTAILSEELVKRSADDWAPVLDAHGVIWGPMLEPAETYDDPQFAALGTFPRYVDPRTNGEVRTVDSPVHFASAPRTITRGAPPLGADTAAVLGALPAWEQERGRA